MKTEDKTKSNVMAKMAMLYDEDGPKMKSNKKGGDRW